MGSRQASRATAGSQGGYTLVELIVVMAVFIIILVVASSAFDQLITSSARYTKSAESNIEGMVGLEQLRYDLEHAGYGLPWSFQNPSSLVLYKECDIPSGELANGVDSKTFNDVPPNLPRAILSGTSSNEVNGNAGANGGLGPDYLVVKSSLAAIESAAKKWSYVNYSSSFKSFLRSYGGGENLAVNDRAVTLSSTFRQGMISSRQLVMDGGTFAWTVTGVNPPAGFQPGDGSQFYMAYGVASQNLKMPYNRADFFLHRPDEMPGRCNANTGLLYKGVANHGNTGFTLFPLVDCVGDLQVEFELDPGNTGNPVYSENLLGMDAEAIRSQLKAVRVYLLTHEGIKDRNFKYPIKSANNVLQVGNPRRSSSGRTWSSANMQSVFGSDWRNYRWKIYTLVARPKTLN